MDGLVFVGWVGWQVIQAVLPWGIETHQDSLINGQHYGTMNGVA